MHSLTTPKAYFGVRLPVFLIVPFITMKIILSYQWNQQKIENPFLLYLV